MLDLSRTFALSLKRGTRCAAPTVAAVTVPSIADLGRIICLVPFFGPLFLFLLFLSTIFPDNGTYS